MKRAIVLFITMLIVSCSPKTVIVTVTELHCEHQVNPQGIDCPSPRLSWQITSNARDVRQEAYHILVASSLEKLNAGEGDLWDSQPVESGESVFIPYSGKPLSSRDECYWKVKVVTNKGTSSWSQPASWTMGLIQPSDWEARWIGLDKSFPEDVLIDTTRLSARYFRKEFVLENKTIEKATLYISGLGLYEAYINARRVGSQVLSPTITDYNVTVKYNTFDVKELLSDKNSVIGIVLGNGRFFAMRDQTIFPEMHPFGFPKMIFQLEINYTDGSTQTLGSDDTWKVTAAGPIRSNNEFDGEEYDARMEMPGWNKLGFDDSQWLQAERVDAPKGKLEAQINRNIQIMEIIHPIAVTEPKPGMYILDMGQNMVGWLRMKVKGNAGDQVQLRFAEILKNDGTLYMDNIRGAKVTDKYILKGGTTESWEPSFTYHGFRFVEITGYPGKPSIEDFEGKIIYDEMEVTGTFETSDSTINQIYKNAYWGIRGNYRGMPTDCPQRGERMGWLGDRAIGSHGESFIFNNNDIYAKWLDDISQSQREDGSIPDIAPKYWSLHSDNMTWPGTYIIIANMLYEQYGNKEPVVKHYESMKKWLYYMRDHYMVDNIMPKDRYGDWCMPPESPELIHSQDPLRKTEAAVLGTTYYFRMLSLMERFAGILGKAGDEKDFAQQAALVKKAFNNKFFNKETGQYSNNTVTANLLSLSYGMVPEEYKEAVFKNIVEKTMGEFKGHISTGLIGTQWLMRGLTSYGRPDIAFKIATNRDYPSWGYMIEKGATTIWELWNGDTADPRMNSHNHVMLLGDLIIWYYENLAGIQNAPGSTGFKHLVMKPYPVEGLSYVKASFHSVNGLIKSEWSKKDGSFIWNLSIPCNATATVYIPASLQPEITESGKKAFSAEGLKFIKNESGYAVFEVASGEYHFVSKGAGLMEASSIIPNINSKK